MKWIRRRLTYANVMSSIAMFLLLGGGAAFAAHGLGRHTVGSRQLKANAVTAKKIRKSAVTNRKLRANSVTGGKVKDGSLTGADVNAGTLGTVPSALAAASATNAVNAQKVNGQTLTKIFKTLLPGETNVSVATISGFDLTASCAAGNVDVVLSSPASPGSVLSAQGNGENSEGQNPYFEYESEANGTSSKLSLDDGNAFGQVSFSGALEDGTAISGVLGYDYETFGGAAPHRCIVYGHAVNG